MITAVNTNSYGKIYDIVNAPHRGLLYVGAKGSLILFV